jgi:hypothetical protein
MLVCFCTFASSVCYCSGVGIMFILVSNSLLLLIQSVVVVCDYEYVTRYLVVYKLTLAVLLFVPVVALDKRLGLG